MPAERRSLAPHRRSTTERARHSPNPAFSLPVLHPESRLTVPGRWSEDARCPVALLHEARSLGSRGRTSGCLNESDEVLAKDRSEEHTSELQSRLHLVCRLLLEKKKK